ncbi:copper homeostasis protein CutC [Liquorilactobacillus ghanensis]|uniref:copper homeostasis protein CutC n=1 Tax=Liquorilactobacillus ghanensis TaxID=399370 RepID=UPI0039E79332
METLEVCCGNYQDALAASQAGAERIELNSALFLGGLTPTLSALRLTKQTTNLKVICMVRPRGAGFCYSEAEFKEILTTAELLLANGADGLSFGFLTEAGEIDIDRTRQLVEITHGYDAEAVFHRAFDCSIDPVKNTTTLIKLHLDRILTSGLQPTAWAGRNVLAELQKNFGKQIEILAGSGINPANVRSLISTTGIKQVHASCTVKQIDQTAYRQQVDFSYLKQEVPGSYEAVSPQLVRQLLAELK